MSMSCLFINYSLLKIHNNIHNFFISLSQLWRRTSHMLKTPRYQLTASVKKSYNQVKSCIESLHRIKIMHFISNVFFYCRHKIDVCHVYLSMPIII